MIAWFAGAFPSEVGALRDQRGEPCGSSETPEARARIHREGAEVGQAAGGGGQLQVQRLQSGGGGASDETWGSPLPGSLVLGTWRAPGSARSHHRKF